MAKHLAERTAALIEAEIKARDAVAESMEVKWGHGRLTLLVRPETAARFNTQREIVNDAVWADKPNVGQVATACQAMIKGWHFLDAEAESLGAEPLRPEWWETLSDDGTVIVIAKSNADAWAAARANRRAAVFSLEEVGRVLGKQSLLVAAKQTFPGSRVVSSQTHNPPVDLDDEIPF